MQYYIPFLVLSMILFGCNSNKNKTESKNTENGANTEDEETHGISTILPKHDNSERDEYIESLPEELKLNILIREDDKVEINNELIGNVDQMRAPIDAFISKNNPDYYLLLQTEHGTSYETYINVQDIIKAIYLDIRRDVSLHEYSQPYDSLKSDYQAAINLMVPERLLELAPKEKK